MLTVKAVDHLVFNVRNVDASARWYEQVLGMVREDRQAPSGDIRTSMVFGQNKINLRPLNATQEAWFTGMTPCPGSDDICFLTETSPDDVARHFRENGVEIVLGPVTKSGALGAIRSVYVRDLDGNLVEVSSYCSSASLG
ncbi:VOC family protein [Sphingomonas glacialis]|uniref:VOC family protein n=1 Tax=Sphingomonas glacialis TaxID=658225 RepID=A0A502FB31_9SPHN|nr:VOC family protein [Sphingomonas glacialis]TPG46531.1 VOC family protein [Sphingomonas glacialis]